MGLKEAGATVFTYKHVASIVIVLVVIVVIIKILVIFLMIVNHVIILKFEIVGLNFLVDHLTFLANTLI